MSRLPLLLLLLLLVTGASAQEMRRLTGYVQIPGQEISKYFIQISISGTKISGYSITEERGNRLRAMVSGVRDPESEMTLEESKADNPGYCYFTAKLKLTVISGRQRWAGPFESHESNGRLCGKGYMTLLDEAPAPPPPVKVDPPKPKPVAPKPPPVQAPPKPKPVPADTPKPKPRPVAVIDTPKPKPRPLLPAPSPPDPPKPRPVVVQAPPPKPPLRADDSCIREYRWQGDSLVFEVWDGWTQDGDVISIVIDGKRLLDHRRLGQQKERFALPLGKGRHRLDLEFHEEGTEPPNTPNLILYDGPKRYELNISGNTNQRARICFDR